MCIVLRLYDVMVFMHKYIPLPPPPPRNPAANLNACLYHVACLTGSCRSFFWVLIRSVHRYGISILA